ncbi:MAG: N-dimethylarginine dimethylaminohydrolase [Mycobacteriaceae bacterium]|nr:N-dimethylarginine dimethylaminohydrolase [Mycobacteriaceae bacterium]
MTEIVTGRQGRSDWPYTRGRRLRTLPAETARPAVRTPSARQYVMTPPEFFAIEYEINPWMDVAVPADRTTAVRQWRSLHKSFTSLGHTVELVAPVPGLPDMVFAANGGLVFGDTAVLARFKYTQRVAETDAYEAWLTQRGYHVVRTRHVNEGQGDLLIVGEMILAGHGFRTDVRAHAEIAEILRMPVVSLELVDPRFYHLDTALAVLDDKTIAYYPPAFSKAAQRQLRAMFPDAVVVGSADAYVLGLNAVSDGLHVVHPSSAQDFAVQLREAGFDPIAIDLSEMLKGGGSIKCCTLEVHR